MSEQIISKTYNKISDVFSRTQIKAAVEGLSTYRQRIQLIDHIIDRREEIEKSENVAKMRQYAHVFRKMLCKFRKKKSNKEQEQKELKIEMVMQLLKEEKRKKMESPVQESRRLLRYCIMRDQKLPITCKSITTQSTNEPKTEENLKSRKVERFFTEKDPQMVEDEIKEEIYDFLQKDKNLDNLDKERFLKLTDDNQKFRYLENKIKHQLKSQEKQQFQLSVKVTYTLSQNHYNVQNFFHKNYYKGNQIKILKQGHHQASKTNLIGSHTTRNKLLHQESYISYTEIKLNQLYQDSMDVQKSMRSKHQSCRNSIMQDYLITTNKDIINLSNQKLFQIKKSKK